MPSKPHGCKQLYYTDLRSRFGLSAQMAVRCIARVVEASKRDKSCCPTFRPHAAMPYDQRLMSCKGVAHVSLLTLHGRTLIPLVMGTYQRERFTEAKGQCHLVLREDGRWLLLVVVKLPDHAPLTATDFIGVDFGSGSRNVSKCSTGRSLN